MAALLPMLIKAAPTVLKIAGIGSSVNRAIKGAKQSKKARQALENFQRQELRNITEGMRVSTLGAELQTQEAQRRFATSVEALRSGGVRGLVGGLGQQEQLQQRQQQQIAADLDRQQQQIEVMKAQDEARIREMQEARDAFDYAELVGKQAQAEAEKRAGITSAFKQASTFVSSLQENGEPTIKDNTTLPGFMQSQGQSSILNQVIPQVSPLQPSKNNFNFNVPSFNQGLFPTGQSGFNSPYTGLIGNTTNTGK